MNCGHKRTRLRTSTDSYNDDEIREHTCIKCGQLVMITRTSPEVLVWRKVYFDRLTSAPQSVN